MTIVALLLAAYPIPFHQEYLVHLTFVPLLFLGRFTNMGYTLVSAVIVAFSRSVRIWKLTSLWCSTYCNRYHCKYGWTFLKQNDIVALVILNLISVIILLILSIFSPLYDLTEIAFLVPISFVLTIASAITFVDMWHFFSLVTRYENEDKYDYLTGLGNVKEFDRHLNHVSQIAEDKNESLALLLIDIDGFKDVNDTYSHKSGDAVLKQMSQLLKNYVPKQFQIFRNGGEEFSVVIRNYSLDQSVKLAENIRTGVEKSSFHLPNKEVIKLSVSIGVGYLSQDDHKSQRKVFKDADDMVHVAKNEGRNQVMFNPIIKL